MHDASGKCIGCQKIFDRYPNFDEELRHWFEMFQEKNPEAHISCAGRGRQDQEELFARGVTKARWLQSAHNYNLAIDVFVQRNGDYVLDPAWFHWVLYPNLYGYLEWYGAPHSEFFELPHIQCARFKTSLHAGILVPVE